MIDITHEDIERLWNAVVHYVPERQKLDCAVNFVKVLVDQGVDIKTLRAAQEYDEKLTEAVNIVLEDTDDNEEVDVSNYYDEGE